MHQRGYLSGNYLLTVLVMRMLMIIIIIGWFSIELQCSVVALVNFLFSSIFSSCENIFSLWNLNIFKCLEVIDWNYHLHLPLPQTRKKKPGEQMFSWKYYQRAKQWDIKIIKADKGYEYIPLLIANILHARLHDVDIVTRSISLNASDLRLLAPIHCSHTTTSHCRIVSVAESVQFSCTVKKLWTRERWSLEKSIIHGTLSCHILRCIEQTPVRVLSD